ncbi:ABC transporter ATP-binding protein [Eubacteriaceae bacterium ES2]|nr:ABC transporter ATP-binding protein [Eubacteriaceae bacterium ES2]
MDNVIISINNVSKHFGRRIILNQLNLDIKKGQSIALLGHNGTGKSTLLRMICGLASVSSGVIMHASSLKFAYVPEHFPKIDLTAQEYINAMGAIEGLSKEAIAVRSQELFHDFFLDEMLDIPIKHLSKGTIQKVAVIQALIEPPDVLLLDEPLSGQDSQSQKVFINRIRDLNHQGVTVIMSCHEQFLVNQLSQSAYEIRNQSLYPVNLIAQKHIKYDVMLFEADQGEKLNDGILEIIEQWHQSGNCFELVVRRYRTDAVLKLMLKNNFRLLSMGAAEE